MKHEWKDEETGYDCALDENGLRVVNPQGEEFVVGSSDDVLAREVLRLASELEDLKYEMKEEDDK